MNNFFRSLARDYPCDVTVTVVPDNARTHALPSPPCKDNMSLSSHSSRHSRWSDGASESEMMPTRPRNVKNHGGPDPTTTQPHQGPSRRSSVPIRPKRTLSRLSSSDSPLLDLLELGRVCDASSPLTVSGGESDDDSYSPCSVMMLGQPQQSRWNGGVDPDEVSPERMKLRRGRCSLQKPRPKLCRWESDSRMGDDSQHSSLRDKSHSKNTLSYLSLPKTPSRVPSWDGSLTSFLPPETLLGKTIEEQDEASVLSLSPPSRGS